MRIISKIIKTLFVTLGIICTITSLLPQNVRRTQVHATDNRIKAVWAATVYSLDYPTKVSTDANSLRKSADNLLNNVQQMGYNHLFFQVRPSGDALYKSDIFPWSRHLTGKQGTAPDNDFDPLEYLVEEAHSRNIKIHAWVNPYRLTLSAADESNLSSDSIPVRYPHLTAKHTDGKTYLNPGEPEANQLILDGIEEIIKNYKVDGIHLDDYFYPDRNFPDADTFEKYGQNHSDIGDWRRHNVTSLIKSINDKLAEINPDLIFSVSPCGIWANKNSSSEGSDTTGSQAYFDYYADTKLWVKEELVDWIIPQIYWNTGYAAADFETVAKWWDDTVDGTSVSLCIGQSIYKATEATDKNSPWYGQNGINELKHQIDFMNSLKNVKGYAHYRMGSITAKSELAEFAAEVNTSHPESNLPKDIDENPWTTEAITALYEKGVFEGVNNEYFYGTQPISRADFIFILVRVMGKDAVVTDNFDDISPEMYYYKEIGVAKLLGITNGRDGKIFDPQGNITRQEMATLIYRVFEKENKLNYDEYFSLEEKFSDAHQIMEYARTPVAAMADMKLLEGYENGEFRPFGNTTRAEAAVFVDRISKFVLTDIDI